MIIYEGGKKCQIKKLVYWTVRQIIVDILCINDVCSLYITDNIVNMLWEFMLQQKKEM